LPPAVRGVQADLIFDRVADIPGQPYARPMTSSSAEPHLPLVVGIVGAGTMGSGIAQVGLEAGDEILLHDVDEAAIARATDRIRDGLTRRAAGLDLDPDTIDDWVDGRSIRLRSATTLDQVGGESDVVIEAALESLELKRAIFEALDAAAAATTILATNTSAISIAAIAAATTRPQRVVGLHFFNPAPLMALVEVVAGPATDPAVVEASVALVERWGKTAVRSADRPGFIVNRVNRPFTIQALRMLEAGEATVEEIDEALRASGFPMGPFELMDLAGIDVNLAAARGIWEGLGRPDRLAPSPIQRRLVEEERLGRKAGQGFYRYENARRRAVSDEFAAAASATSPDAIRDRILAAIGSEAHRALDEGVASASDIDTALRLGAGHPQGPFERERARAGPG
jgi:3-hydroxybutyryl-CoA dehydrogenase